MIQSCLQNCMRPVLESEERLKMEVENLQVCFYLSGKLTRKGEYKYIVHH